MSICNLEKCSLSLYTILQCLHHTAMLQLRKGVLQRQNMTGGNSLLIMQLIIKDLHFQVVKWKVKKTTQKYV